MISYITLVVVVFFLVSVLYARSRRRSNTALSQGKATDFVKQGKLPEDKK